VQKFLISVLIRCDGRVAGSGIIIKYENAGDDLVAKIRMLRRCS
jgi:hypothetical protein